MQAITATPKRLAEGAGFEPATPIARGNRLAGGRTRPLCDPSVSEMPDAQRYVLCHSACRPTKPHEREINRHGYIRHEGDGHAFHCCNSMMLPSRSVA